MPLPRPFLLLLLLAPALAGCAGKGVPACRGEPFALNPGRPGAASPSPAAAAVGGPR